MKDMIDKIVSEIKSFFSSFKPENRKGSVVGIDIGTSSIKIVQIKEEKGKAVLETYGSILLGSYAGLPSNSVTNLNPDLLGKALADLVKESGITTKDSGSVLPNQQSLVFTMRLPAEMDEKTLKEVIPTEARKYIPVPIDQVSIDWFVIPKREGLDLEEGEVQNQFTEVLVVAIQNEAIKKFQDTLSTVSFNPDFFEVEIFSVIRSAFTHELAPVLVIDIGASKTKLAIVEYGIVKSVHIVNRGSFDITKNIASTLNISIDAAENLKRQYGLTGETSSGSPKDIVRISTEFILSETNGVVLNYEKKQMKTISKVILVGGGVQLKGFIDQATENFRCPVVYGDPFHKLESPAFLAPTLKEIGGEFAGAVGIALRKLQS